MSKVLYAETTISNVKYTIELSNETVMTKDGEIIPPKIDGGMKEVLRFIAEHLNIKLINTADKVVTGTQAIAKIVINTINARRKP